MLERNSNLSEIIRTGTPLNGDVNREMLGTIFYEGTPLHDGAVVVRDGMLKAAGCVLPLSNNLEIGKDMGTRHRAALGMSENSDAVIVVVSEETGIVSLAKNGVMIRRLEPVHPASGGRGSPGAAPGAEAPLLEPEESQ